MNPEIEHLYRAATNQQRRTRKAMRTLAMLERTIERLVMSKVCAGWDEETITRSAVDIVAQSTRRELTLERLLKLTGDPPPVGARRELEQIFGTKEKVR